MSTREPSLSSAEFERLTLELRGLASTLAERAAVAHAHDWWEAGTLLAMRRLVGKVPLDHVAPVCAAMVRDRIPRETLTAEMVVAHRRLMDVLDGLDWAACSTSSQSRGMQRFALECPADIDLILGALERGVRDHHEVRRLVTEMRAGARPLSGGVL